MKSPKSTDKKGRVALHLLLGIAILSLLPAFLWAQVPGWWATRGIQNSNPANDYAAVNQGQVKNIAVKAVAEMDANLPGGAGDALHTLATNLSGTTANTNDYAAVNLGQLKTVAKPFYDRLLSLDYHGHPLESGTYPWINLATPPNDYAMANIGQVKNLFSFDLTLTGTNGLPDWWQNYYFGGLVSDVNAPAPRGDGLTILQAYLQGANPVDYYNGKAPEVTVVSGNNQAGMPGGFVSTPLVVKVTNNTTRLPLSNAPITFSVGNAGGMLSASSAGSTLLSSLALRSGTDGLVSAYFQLPNTYGTSATVAATATSGTQTASQTFTESSIALPNSGLQLWLRADAGITLNGANSVASWTDQSPNGFVLSQANASYQPKLVTNELKGHPVLNFGGNILQTASNVDVFKGNTNWTVFLVAQPGTSQPTYADILDQTHDSVSFAIEQNGGNTNQFGFGNDLITLSSSKMQMVSSVKSSTTQQDYINGLQIANVSVGSFTPAVRKFAVGGWVTGGRNYNGKIAEVLIYNRALSVAERMAVESYLGQKYFPPPSQPSNVVGRGISASQIDLTWQAGSSDALQFTIERKAGDDGVFSPVAVVGANGSSYVDGGLNQTTTYYYRVTASNYSGASTPSAEASAATLANGNVVPLSAAQLWLRADAGTTLNGTNSVASWADQSPNGFVLLQSNMSYQPKLVTNALKGEPALSFSGSLLETAGNVNVFQGNQSYTVFLVTQSGTSQPQYADILDSRIYGQAGGFTIEQNGSTLNQFGFASNLVTLNSGTTQVVSTVNNSVGITQTYINGIQVASAAGVMWSPQVYPFTVGGFTNASYSRYYNGKIAEVIIYSRALSDAERAAVESYLGQKYFLSPAQPLNMQGRSISASQIYLTWQEGQSDIVKLMIERKSNENDAFACVAIVGANTSSYVDSGLAPGTKYFYRVTAINLAGSSEPSAETAATTLTSGSAAPLNEAQLWLRADAGVALNGSNSVISWADQSANAIFLAQTNTSAQPQWVSNGLNGKPVLSFAGSILLTASTVDIFKGNTNWTYFLVTQPGTSQPTYADILDQTHDSVSFAIEQNGGNTNQFGFGNDLITLDSSKMQIVSSVKSNTGQRDCINGAYAGNTTSWNFTPEIRQFAVGGWVNGGVRNYNGKIAEVIIFNRVLTDAEGKAVLNYLDQKYLIAGMDADGDGLTNAQEMALGSDPYNADTNGNGLIDSIEAELGLDPATPNAIPLLPNGVSALWAFDSSLWQLSATPAGDTTPPTIILSQPANAVPQ